MTNETTQTNATPSSFPFGMRLQSAREALGLESKDAAAQLRLNEKIILMLEKDCHTADIPATFLRGYIRSYGKLLQIPEHEIKSAIEPIQHKPTTQSIASINTKQTPPVTSGNYYMQLLTYLIVLTMVGLVGIWWYTHSSNNPAPVVAENQINLPSIDASAPTLAPTLATGPVTTAPANAPAAAPAPEAPIVAAKPQTKAPVTDLSEAENDNENDGDSNTD